MDRQCLLNLVAEGILVLRTASMKWVGCVSLNRLSLQVGLRFLGREARGIVRYVHQ